MPGAPAGTMKNSAPSAEKSDVNGPVLATGEKILAVFRPDLDAELRFADAVIVVTSLRVWFRDERGSGGELLRDAPIDVERREHAGVCELFLRQRGVLAWKCRYTLAQARAAIALAEALGRAPNELRDEASSEPDEDVPVATSARGPLLRLFTFARPRLSMVLLGFGLTLASTGVGLIPPYLTMPLVDKVLVPWQAKAAPGFEAAQRTLVLYLGALGLAAIVAWLLAWAQGAVLAWVSEVISADLRNRA